MYFIKVQLIFQKKTTKQTNKQKRPGKEPMRKWPFALLFSAAGSPVFRMLFGIRKVSLKPVVFIPRNSGCIPPLE